MTRKQHFITILLLGALSTIGPFSIDMYLPGFPEIARDLHTPIANVQLSLTSYFIGICIGQVFYGPLLDRFGRKKPLYIGLGVYIVASIACALVGSVNGLIIMRFLQAFGGCVSLVGSRALVRDLFPVSETAKIFSLLMLVLAVSPMLAPTVGGYVSVAFGWHSIFIILAIITILILIACFYFLPDGKKPDPTISLKPGPILNSFFTVFKQTRFFTYAISGGFASAVTYAYVSGSPDVFMNIYKVEERHYGWIFAFIAAGIIGCNQLNRLFLRWYTSEQLILAGLIWQVSIGIILIIGTANGWFGLKSLIICIFLFMSGQGFSVPNASALSLAPFTRLAGSASALLGTLQLGLGSVASAAVSLLHDRTALPMNAVMTLCSVISLVVFILGKRVVDRKDNRQEVEKQARLAI